MSVHPDLLKILVCPLSKAPLILEGNRLISTDQKTRKSYPIRENIPILLVQEAETLSEEEWKRLVSLKN
ncbi:MAG: Trm112 family protein [Planctomycetota bacterium]